MAAEPVDVLVIGGGITGAGIARDAALRGYRTALVEKGDFAAGTSSVSSRLIHGGLRYLEAREFGLVREALRERAVLLRTARHLVRPLPFVFPIYRGSRVSAWKLRLGMWVYGILASGRNVERHHWLAPKHVRALEPGLRDRELVGAALYYDAQVNDARLVLAVMRGAAQEGALVANYAEATALAKPDGRVRGAMVRDVLTGGTATVRALVVVNATGPWADTVRRLDDPKAPALLRLTKGAHVAVPRARLGHSRAVTLFSPIDGRVMFVVPWGDQSYIGTTDTDTQADPDDVRADADDIIYLLRSANAYFPSARLAPHDVVATWAGLRPLVSEAGVTEASAVSREHVVHTSPTGLITIMGGKLTTFRVMARDVVDVVARQLKEMDGRPIVPPPPTDRLPVPGAEAKDLGVLVEGAKGRHMPEPVARHLVACYGSEVAAVLNHLREAESLGRPLVPGRPAIWAEVRHAVEREMAMRLADVLMRRLRLHSEAPADATRIAPAVARLMGQLLSWDEARETAEVAAYLALADRARQD